jgi:peptidylprolyl isomerase
MSSAKTGSRVRANYTVTLENGNVFDMVEGHEPLEFTVGEGEVIQGLEEAVIGMKAGDTKTVTTPPEKAYGPRHKELIMNLKRTEFPDNIKPTIGLEIQGSKPDGNTIDLIITDMTDEEITLDANHPLAGETLILDVELVGVD